MFRDKELMARVERLENDSTITVWRKLKPCEGLYYWPIEGIDYKEFPVKEVLNVLIKELDIKLHYEKGQTTPDSIEIEVDYD